MLNNKKYVLQKTAKYALCTILALTISYQTANITNTSIPFTKEDLKNNKKYIQELVEIQMTKPEFQNQDLLIELFNQGIDIEHPETVKSITIKKTLIKKDFKDLKYFPNLTELTIENNDIDLSDLKYNHNLINLQLTNTTLTNTKDLPNSIYNLAIQDSVVEDNSFEVPYKTKYLTIANSPFNNIYLKNPEQLNRLTIIGNTFLDLSAFEECTNLNEITIHRIANIKGANILTKLTKAHLNLDNYLPIWMNAETFEQLGLEDEKNLNIIKELDKITSSIIKENMSDEEKVKSITSYILTLLTYDEDITKPELKDYNDNPLILNNQEGICINYASLFTALANRVGLDTYQIYSKDHTWNMINSPNPYFIDLSMLDTEVIIKTLTEVGVEYYESPLSSLEHLNNNEESTLYHYHITLEELLNDNNLSMYTLLPEEKENKEHNLGYIKNKGFSIKFNNNLYFIEYSAINKLIIMLTLLTLSALLLKKKKDIVYDLK